MDRKFDTRSSLRGSQLLWGGLSGRVELIMPLQAFHSNLTYAVLCTITSSEALIKGLSSNGARKQKQKQRNKWFCSNPRLLFTSCSSRPFCLLTSLCLLLISFSPVLPPHRDHHHHHHQNTLYVKAMPLKAAEPRTIFPHHGCRALTYTYEK